MSPQTSHHNFHVRLVGLDKELAGAIFGELYSEMHYRFYTETQMDITFSADTNEVMIRCVYHEVYSSGQLMGMIKDHRYFINNWLQSYPNRTWAFNLKE